MRNKIKISLLLLTMIMLAFSFHPEALHAQNAKADSLFTEAQMALSLDQNYNKATQLYKEVIKLQPENATAHNRLGTIYLGQGNYTDALTEFRAAVKYAPNNEDYKDGLGEVLLKQGEFDEAASIFKDLAAHSNSPIPYQLKESFAYEMNEEYQKAADILNQIPVYAVDDPEQLLMDKFKLNARLDNTDSVTSLAHELIKIAPDNPSYYAIAGLAEEERNNGKEAVRIMDSAVARFPQDAHIITQAVGIFRRNDSLHLISFLDQALASKEYTSRQKTILFYLLLANASQDHFSDSLAHAKLPEVAFGNPPNADAIVLYAALMAKEGDTAKALSVSRQGIEVMPNNAHLWTSLIQIFNIMEASDSLAHYLPLAIKRFPKNRMPLYYNALFIMEKDTLGAIANLEKAKLLDTRDSLISDYQIVSILGDLYQSIGNDDSAEVNFKAAIDIDDSNPFLLNNYSYLLAEQGKNLDEALDMSNRSLEARPNEPNFLDTYGWILFKQKRFEESLRYVQNAIDASDDPSATFYEHLGDIEEAIGNIKKAKENWRIALEKGSKNQELKKRVND